MSISLHTGVSEIVPQHRVHHNDLPILRDICVVTRAVRAVFGLQGFYIGKGQRIAHQYRNRITVVRGRVASAFILTELRLLRLVHKLLALRVPEPHYQQLIAAVIELHGHIAVAVAVQIGEVNAFENIPHIVPKCDRVFHVAKQYLIFQIVIEGCIRFVDAHQHHGVLRV